MAAVGMKLIHGVRIREKDMPPSGSLEVYMKHMKACEYFSRLSKEGNKAEAERQIDAL
jgi:hypothetical protein